MLSQPHSPPSRATHLGHPSAQGARLRGAIGAAMLATALSFVSAGPARPAEATAPKPGGVVVIAMDSVRPRHPQHAAHFPVACPLHRGCLGGWADGS